ncbi:hypothetical protein P7K49_003262 [Saguinus oedipus]|uniref:Uncharacterized protein n=1 Tax=Saguinus oedipus TaxID=9490 RepID=A0ABQ9WJN1_SAGOE|nr:hypothetical protein P7K49_003262 [Saguinus oedipus]
MRGAQAWRRLHSSRALQAEAVLDLRLCGSLLLLPLSAGTPRLGVGVVMSPALGGPDAGTPPPHRAVPTEAAASEAALPGGYLLQEVSLDALAQGEPPQGGFRSRRQVLSFSKTVTEGLSTPQR